MSPRFPFAQRRSWLLLAVCFALLLPLFPAESSGPRDDPPAPVALPGLAGPGSGGAAAPLSSAGQVRDEPAWAALTQAEWLRREIQPEAARAAFAALAEHPDPALAAAARVGLATLRWQAGGPAEAAALLQETLARYPDTPATERALLLLAIARREAGPPEADRAALATLDDPRLRNGRLRAHVAYQAALCAEALGDAPGMLGQVAQALDEAPRLLRIEALELKLKTLTQPQHREEALATWNQLHDLGMAPAYKADARLAAARLLRELERPDEAARLLADVVARYPSVPQALTALDTLAELEAQELVTFYQAGMVRYYAGQYARAQANFEGALSTPGEVNSHAAARYFHAVSRLRQGAELEAAEALLRLPGLHPASDWAPEALMRAGRLLEGLGQTDQALAAYSRLARDYPASSLAGQGRLRMGMILVLQGRPADAAPALAALADSDAASGLRAEARLWLGKLEASAGRPEAAADHWRAGAAVAPLSFGGLRSAGLLAGEQSARSASGGLEPGKIAVSPAETAEVAAWLADRGFDGPALGAELAADPALARVDELLWIGQTGLATWEADDLATRSAGDLGRQTVLALALAERGLARQALLRATDVQRAAALTPSELPVALRKLLYPLPYAQHFATHGATHGVDPLLLAALVRQESHFDASARSRADARGLAQVLPSTGASIARALGKSGFQASDLYRPEISLEFGAYYLGQALRERGGNVFPALAGYNAGPGAVDGWLRQFGAADLDLFALRIPYAETEHYVRVVFENYGMYRALYGAG